MRADDFQGKYYSPENDNIEKAVASNTNSPILTLRHLNKLKKMRAAKDLENLMRADFMEIIYGSPPEVSPGGPGGF